jgi:CRP-like cAMP-binding protein
VIVDGEASETIDGVQVATLGRGDTVGEVGTLDRPLRLTTVTAVTAMVVLVMTPREFASLLHAVPTVSCRILAEQSARPRAAQWAGSLHALPAR